MNNSKTELILFGGSKQLPKCSTESMQVDGSLVSRTTSVKLLGADLDENLKMDQFVAAKCKVASHTLYNIRKIRAYLSVDTCKTIVQALVISKLDYANGLLYGINEDLLNRLQLVQNMAAKLCLNRRKYDSATDALKALHWLPIRFRV